MGNPECLVGMRKVKDGADADRTVFAVDGWLTLLRGLVVPFLPRAKGVSREWYCELKEEGSSRSAGERRQGRPGNSYHLRGGGGMHNWLP